MKGFLLALLFIYSISARSQGIIKCGDSYLHSKVAAMYPETNTIPAPAIAQKASAGEHVTIPLVFHIVLTQAQINQLGSETNIKRFIDSQIVKTTRDFNAQNADSISIPDAFKSLFGNAHISFALAHTAPDGSPTPGYEILPTVKSGFNFGRNTYGSQQVFSDAKYSASGGLDAWDPATYLNIWVINAIDNSTSSDILGLCIPPSFAQRRSFPSGEVGVVLSYTVWRKPINAFLGRTLTHELGHYFELKHIWGDDDGKCPSTGGFDDGIDDTPPQSLETYGCPQFPKYDACSKSFPGIMFMNYMDYTDDNCQHLFTVQQVAVMRSQVQPNAYSFSLTQHPEIVNYPAGKDNTYTIYPNPGGGHINVRFDRVSSGVRSIRIVNMLGQLMAETTVDVQKGFYYFDISHAGAGMYFMQIEFADKIVVERIMIGNNL